MIKDLNAIDKIDLFQLFLNPLSKDVEAFDNDEKDHR